MLLFRPVLRPRPIVPVVEGGLAAQSFGGKGVMLFVVIVLVTYGQSDSPGMYDAFDGDRADMEATQDITPVEKIYLYY